MAGIRKNATSRNDRGAAEMVGVLMLIALFVVVIGIIAVVLFSSPPGDKKPAVNLRITNESRIITIAHAGGDALQTQNLQIYVDGTLRTFTGFGTDDTWTTGEEIQYTLPPGEKLPSKVDVVYTTYYEGGSSSNLLAQLLLGDLTSISGEPLFYTIRAQAGTGGTITPSGVFFAQPGESRTFAVNNESAYVIADVTDNGVSLGTIDTYNVYSYPVSLSSIYSDHTIIATFTPISATASGTHYINATNTSGGDISPKGIIPVANNGTQTFTITPDPGYMITSVMVNGTSVGAPSTYTFPDVYENQSIRASFGTIYLPNIIGTYYKDRQWSLPGRTKEHYRIQFANAQAVSNSSAVTDANDWPAAPDYISQTNNFSVNYSGLLRIDVPDNYRFYMRGCSGNYLSINNVVLINNLGNPAANTRAYTYPQTDQSSLVSLSPGYYNFIARTWVSNAASTLEQGSVAIYYTNTSTGSTQTLITNFNHTPFTEPTADFTGVPLTGTAPHTVQFTDNSAYATTWTWDFGDGSAVSNAQNPSHTYTSAGVYTVTLTAANSFGSDTKVRTGYITVASSGSCVPGLHAVYYANTSWADPGSSRTDDRIWFSDRYTGFSSDPTDDTNWPTSILPSKEYFSVFWDGYMNIPSNGTYIFRLTTDDGGYLWIDSDPSSDAPTIDNGGLHSSLDKSATVTLTPGQHYFAVKMYEQTERAVAYLEYRPSSSSTFVPVEDVCHIEIPPVAAFSGTPTTGTAPMSVTFTDQSTNSPTSWLWNFGDGNTTGNTLKNPTHLYTSPGSYTVTLTVTNAAGSGSSTQLGYITAAYPTFVRRVNAGGSSYTDTSGNLWSADQAFTTGGWGYVTAGSTSTTANAISGTLDDTLYQAMRSRNSLEYRFTVPNGDYDVTLKFAEIVNSVGSGGRVFDVLIEGSQVMNNADIYALAGNSRYAAYDRTFSTTVSDGVLNINFNRESGQSAMVSAIGLDLDVPVPVAAFSGTPTAGESPLQVTFTDESTNVPTSWLWNFGDGNTTGNTLKHPVHLYTADGTYTVTLTATNDGGSNTVTRTSYIKTGPQPPVADFTATPVSGNIPLSVAFTDTSMYTPTSWSWNFGDGDTSASRNPTHVYTTAGTYTVTLTATNAMGSDGETKTGYITATTPPVVTGISPSTGSSDGGTTVTITGQHMAGATQVMFGTTAGTIVSNTGTQIVATSPAHTAGPVHITVTTSAGTSTTSSADLFTYYTIQTFTTSTTWTVPSGVSTVEYLVVGGGGGGGAYGAGGGAGGFRTNTLTGLSGDQIVTVGDGGAGGTYHWDWDVWAYVNGPGSNGGNSAFGSVIATGGGGGAGSNSQNGLTGGSGGGATGTGSIGYGTSGQGNNGGTGKQWGTRYMGGGGGGASAAGGSVTGTTTPYVGGSGGAGSYSSITGSSLAYAGGGGGGGNSNGGSTAGSGGIGGGGAGRTGNNDGYAATYYGSGGGGGGSGGDGGAGYQGIVIIKYY